MHNQLTRILLASLALTVVVGCGNDSATRVNEIDASANVAPEVYGEKMAEMEAERERARAQANR